MPETARPGTTSGERRRAGDGSSRRRPGSGIPDGPSGGAVAPALWDALREAVLWAQAEWERAVEHAAGMDEVSTHLAQLCAAIRQQASGQNADLGGPAPQRALPPAGGPRSAPPSSSGPRRCPRPTRHNCSACWRPSSR